MIIQLASFIIPPDLVVHTIFDFKILFKMIFVNELRITKIQWLEKKKLFENLFYIGLYFILKKILQYLLHIYMIYIIRLIHFNLIYIYIYTIYTMYTTYQYRYTIYTRISIYNIYIYIYMHTILVSSCHCRCFGCIW